MEFFKLLRAFGFSTGSLEHSDFRAGLQRIRASKASALELSTLRESELDPLLASIEDLDLSRFQHISVHAPSRLERITEKQLITKLQPIVEREFPIIVHADLIENLRNWRDLGSCLCIENMDKRKLTGRYLSELRPLLDELPDSTVCFDIGHARQVDSTMTEARFILEEYSSRIIQIHFSEVTSNSMHEKPSLAALLAFRSILDLVPEGVPVILEYAISESHLDSEIVAAESFFNELSLSQFR